MVEKFYVFYTDTDTGKRKKAWGSIRGHHVVQFTEGEAQETADNIVDATNVRGIELVSVRTHGREGTRGVRAFNRKVRRTHHTNFFVEDGVLTDE